MNKNKKYVFIVLACVMVFLFAGLWLAGHWQNKNNPIRMVYIPKVVDEESDFWSSLIEGAEAAAKEYGAELTVSGPDSENDYLRQNKIMEDEILKKPDVILISPNSYTEITKEIKKVLDAGIKVVFVDSSIDDMMGAQLVATDNVQAGEKLGSYLAGQMPENPVIGVVAHVKGSSTAMEREEGLRNGLKSYGDNIVGTVYCDSDYQKAYNVTTELIEANPDINVLVGLNEYSAVGAARAVKDLGLEQKILMGGFDSSIEEIQLLEEGVFKAIVVQKPFNMGYLGVERAFRAVYGDKNSEPVDSGSELITKENMYTEENQKLLFHFRESN